MPERRRLLSLLAFSVALLAGLAVAVSDQTFLLGETAVLQAFNDVPTWIGWPSRIVMQLGTLWSALPLIAGVAWLVRDRRATLALVLATMVALRLDNVLKEIIDRPRPPRLVEGLHVRETISGHGFPSGHATMAFALAASVHPVVPRRWRWLPWTLALVVGLARMHVGVHWPADVVGGAALGTAIGSAAWLLVTATVGRRDGGC